ncbi:MAG: glycosyltransferase family 4 protein, partial [Cyanobacteria bacterium J06632_3]
SAAPSLHSTPRQPILAQGSSSPIKVSIIASDLSRQGAGRWQGAVRPFLLAAALQKIGHTVEILGFADDPHGASFTTEFPIKILQRRSYPGFLRSAQQLSAQITGDIVYAYKPKPSSYGVALYQRWRTGRPVILDIDDWELSWHGGDQSQYPESWRQLARDILKPDGALKQPDHPLYLRWLERHIAKANAVTLHTQFLQDRFAVGQYVPNGKDTELFDPNRYSPADSRAKYGLSNYKVLMFPGAPRPYKGLEDVLAALEQLGCPDYRLVIVGGSPYDDYDAKLIQRWGQWIIKLPKQDYAAMPEVIAAAHALVIPQRDTPAAKAQFPLKLTDGMSMAKPILATRVGDIPQILGDTGYLVEPDSSAALAQGIQTIFSQFDAAQEKAQRARTRCLQHYSIDAMSDRLVPILAQLQGNPASG